MQKPNSQSYDYMAKIVIIGNSAVGKTNIMLRYINKNYTVSTHTPTIGVDFKSKVVELTSNKNSNIKKLKLQIWDTAGQERYRTITETYYNGVAGVIIVYSIDDRKSFQDLQQWLLQIAQYKEKQKGQQQQTNNLNKKQEYEFPLLILGNKCDLNQERKVNYEEGRIMADENNAMFMQVSAKENINIEEAFQQLAKKICEKAEKQSIGGNNTFINKIKRKNSNITLQNQVLLKSAQKQNKNCC